MKRKTLKSWIANAMFAMAVSSVMITVSSKSYANTKTVQVQDSYTIDELFSLVKSKYADAEKRNEHSIKIETSDGTKLVLNLSKDGTSLFITSYWGKDDDFTLKKLNKINSDYNFGRVYLDKDEELAVQYDVILEGASKDYILGQIKRCAIYHTIIIPELFK